MDDVSSAPPARLPLFDDAPEGLRYDAAFVTASDADDLVSHIQSLEFSNFEMRGAIARRRVAFFGQSYRKSQTPAEDIPAFLWPLRARISAWANVGADAFAMALINEYRPGAPIGWHRDAPQYDIVAGVSLVSVCRMRFRPYVAPRALAAPTPRGRRKTTFEITLVPGSAYLMTGPSRQEYEHSIPPVDSLRYSVTFRTLRE